MAQTVGPKALSESGPSQNTLVNDPRAEYAAGRRLGKMGPCGLPARLGAVFREDGRQGAGEREDFELLLEHSPVRGVGKTDDGLFETADTGQHKGSFVARCSQQGAKL